MGNDKRQEALQMLLDKAESQGYVIFDDILDCADSFSLPLQDFDWLSGAVTSRGVIVYDTAPDSQSTIESDDFNDFAQVDYEEIFKKVVSIEPNLAAFIDYIRSIKPPQHREVEQLKYLAQEGNIYARQRMIEMNLRQAVRIALKRVELFNLDMESTLGDACVGLVIAIDKYDPDSSGPLASYVSLWIVQNISREQPTQNPLLYFPVHKKEEYYTAYPQIAQRGCPECDQFQYCEKVRTLIGNLANVINVEDIIAASTPMDSIDELSDRSIDCYGDDFDEYLDAMLYGKRIEHGHTDSFDVIASKDLSKAISEVFSTLTPREANVLSLRFGLSTGHTHTLEEVGQSMGVTRERIRQIEAKALRKLRHPTRSKKLKDFYG